MDLHYNLWHMASFYITIFIIFIGFVGIILYFVPSFIDYFKGINGNKVLILNIKENSSSLMDKLSKYEFYQGRTASIMDKVRSTCLSLDNILNTIKLVKNKTNQEKRLNEIIYELDNLDQKFIELSKMEDKIDSFIIKSTKEINKILILKGMRKVTDGIVIDSCNQLKLFIKELQSYKVSDVFQAYDLLELGENELKELLSLRTEEFMKTKVN